MSSCPLPRDLQIEVRPGHQLTWPPCLRYRWGEHAVRVRVVPSGGSFRDDLVSALVPPADGFGATDCDTLALSGSGQTITSGNLQAAVGADGLLTFTRLSDKKVLLAEASLRSLTPTTTVPEREGFYAFNISFHANEGERIYGLGQHKTGLLDNVGGNFQLAPKNTEILSAFCCASHPLQVSRACCLA